MGVGGCFVGCCVCCFCFFFFLVGGGGGGYYELNNEAFLFAKYDYQTQLSATWLVDGRRLVFVIYSFTELCSSWPVMNSWPAPVNDTVSVYQRVLRRSTNGTSQFRS